MSCVFFLRLLYIYAMFVVYFFIKESKSCCRESAAFDFQSHNRPYVGVVVMSGVALSAVRHVL